jgi:CO/xanthine dehydrogenase Mo-binding subunit
MVDFQVVNKGYPQVDAIEKVIGRRRFISDIRMPGMLWGRVVRSLQPHARIKGIDTSKALRVPGVRAIVTAADTPQIRVGPFVPDWEILANKKVIYVGQPVAAVAALHPDAAEEASQLVEVEYEELPAVFDPVEAMGPRAPLINEERENNIVYTFKNEKGDVEKAFEESDYIREGVFHPSSQFHAYLEPNGAIASYDPISGSYTLWAATQTPYPAWLLYSRALGIGPEKLHLIQAPMGGAFGGKFENNLHLIAACLSKKIEGTVRLVNALHEEFLTAPLRLPMQIHIKMGIKKDGLITAKEVEVVADNGAFTYWGPAVLSTVCYRVDNLYRILNSKAIGYLTYTNNVPKGALRGFGQPQSLFAAEAILDMLAEDAGIDPGELRLKNSFKSGEKTIYGWVIGSCGLPECIKKAQEKSGWFEKRKKYASQIVTKRRGIGLACCNHVSGNRACLREFDGASAMVKVNADAKVIVFTGEVDIGQGYTTVAAQCAAEELGVPLNWVEVAPVDSQTSILGIGSFASRGTLMGGNAVRIAAGDARQKILTAVGALLDKDSNQLRFERGRLLDNEKNEDLGSFKEIIAKLVFAQGGQPFIGIGNYVPDTCLANPETKYGNPSPAYPFGAHVAEVEVDIETGQVEVVHYVAANDVGKAINPLLVKGQLEGGIVQGMGYALSEHLIFNQGKIVYKNFLDYKIPTMKDIPPIEPIIVEEEDPYGPYGAKSVGEAALDPVAAAICNAIYNAVGVRITKLPVTPEALLEAIKAKEIARNVASSEKKEH